MNLTAHSRTKILETFARWDVSRDFADPMYNYLVYGYSPGSCFTAVLANDFIGAMRSSHPANTVNAFKSLAGWLNEHCPEEAYGSYEKVKYWAGINTEQRRIILEHNRLIYPNKEEVILILKDTPIQDPVLY